jgi:ubiquinone/menaquinone biosynthesis C-methylase UbiE
MSTTLAAAPPRMSMLGLLFRLLVARGRNRADLCYTFMGTENRPGADCTFLNLGYWRLATSYRAAAEALVDLLGDAARLGPGDQVVDCGCGFGDQDLRWMQTRAPARIVALNVTELQIEHAKANKAHPAIEYRLGSATALPFEPGTVDKVVSLEAAFHFDTRETFLKEAFRVLRPGGRLAVIDMLPLEQGGKVLTGGIRGAIERWSYQVPAANVYGVTEYRRILERSGFVDVGIESIRDQVFPGFQGYLDELLADSAAVRRLHPFIRRSMQHMGDHFRTSDYILVTAGKPAG